MSVFIDTNVLVGATVRTDGHHVRSSMLLRTLAPEEQVITDHVLVESFGLIRRRAGHGVARAFWLGIREVEVRIEMVTAPDLERARTIAEEWSDHRFSVVDCTSFAVMDRVGCSRVATFDNDFAIYRYGLGRRKAFEIVR